MRGLCGLGGRMKGAMLVLLAVMLLAGPAQAYTVKQIMARMSAGCGETITTGQAVTILDADGLAYKADANDATLRPAVGVAGKGCTTGGNVEIVVQGILSGWSALAESTPGFLSETAGAVTQSAPAYSQQIGVAISATDYYFNAQNYFDTSSLTALGADVTITGTTPSLTIGDSGDEDTWLVFDGQAGDDFYIAFDTADDDLKIGYGGATEAAAGTQTAITITDAATPGVTITNAFAANGDTTIGNAVTDDLTITAAILGATPLILDGATDDTNELTIGVLTDPSADKTVKIPSLTDGTLMISTLVTNDVDVANSVWAVSNGLALGGATGADGFETKITVVDPTADRTVTIPDATGTVDLVAAATHNYAGAAVAWSMTVTEAQATFVSVSNANGAVDAVKPAALAGKAHIVYNNSGQTLTFKVTGQAGASLANGKYGLYVDNGTDIVEIYEQP